MDIYAKNILDHYQRPRNFGPLEDADIHQQESNRSCGDEITIHLKLEGGRINFLSFEGRGCAISMAAMSILSEELVGREAEQVMNMGLEEVESFLGIEISPRRQRCASLGLRAIQGALASLRLRTEKKAETHS
ncbi:MAG: iron-sulfur cluster assembly scaffold protein [Bacillota bacterium]